MRTTTSAMRSISIALLWYAGRFEEALRIYEALADAPGRARCLLDLGRTDEALAILDGIGSDGFTALRRDRV